jgi:hypothetical protein
VGTGPVGGAKVKASYSQPCIQLSITIITHYLLVNTPYSTGMTIINHYRIATSGLLLPNYHYLCFVGGGMMVGDMPVLYSMYVLCTGTVHTYIHVLAVLSDILQYHTD